LAPREHEWEGLEMTPPTQNSKPQNYKSVGAWVSYSILVDVSTT